MEAIWKPTATRPTYSKKSSRNYLTASRADTRTEMTRRPGRLVLLGHPVSHSLSPVFQNAALRASNIPLVYEALDVTDRELRTVIRQLKASNAAGNVTIPQQIAVHDLCDHLTDLAAKVGAVNTFWFDAKKLHGDNTDVGGFDAAARALLCGGAVGARVVVLGAGGAAAAVLAALEEWPDAKAAVVARHNERAARLVQRFPAVARG